jgi:hypothetical protein
MLLFDHFLRGGAWVLATARDVIGIRQSHHSLAEILSSGGPLTELLISQGPMSCLTPTWLRNRSRYRWIQELSERGE